MPRWFKHLRQMHINHVALASSVRYNSAVIAVSAIGSGQPCIKPTANLQHSVHKRLWASKFVR